MNIKTCSFFGHRKIEITEELKQKVKEVIEDLIDNHNVLIFLFGSRSDFDYLCHWVVTELREKYPQRLYMNPEDGAKRNLQSEDMVHKARKRSHFLKCSTFITMFLDTSSIIPTRSKEVCSSQTLSAIALPKALKALDNVEYSIKYWLFSFVTLQ